MAEYNITERLKQVMIKYIQSLTTGITCEQLINQIEDMTPPFLNVGFKSLGRQEIRKIVHSLIYNPHIEMKFGYIYWRD